MNATLGEVIQYLKSVPPETLFDKGFGAPMSYRGDYSELAFFEDTCTTAARMLAHAESALGATFTGYKGGRFRMHEHTTCWIVKERSALGAALVIPGSESQRSIYTLKPQDVPGADADLSAALGVPVQVLGSSATVPVEFLRRVVEAAQAVEEVDRG
jgi:hypothetical protein